MLGVKLTWEGNTEEPGGKPAHILPHPELQAPWQDAETKDSAGSQEMGRGAYAGEDPQGFLRPVEVWGRPNG